MWSLNPRHAAHNTHGRKRRAFDATPVCAAVQTKLDVDHFVQQSRNKRLELLEVRVPTHKTPNLVKIHAHEVQTCVQRQALETLRTAVDSCEHPVFPCALIAGDVVILELLAKLDYLKTGKVAVAFVDTFHLFPETITFLKQLEVCCVLALLPFRSSQTLHNRITEILSKRHVTA